MKYFKITAFVFAIVLNSCKKQPSDTVNMQVLEYKSQIPVSDVTVTFIKNKIVLQNGFPWFAETVFKTGITDGNGNYPCARKDLEEADVGIILTKTKYWKGRGGEGKQYMSPDAYLNLRLLKTTVYQGDYYMTMLVQGEHSKSAALYFSIPNDSSISLRAFGNETSTYLWSIKGIAGICPNPPCLEDTIARGSFPINLAKGETGSYTLKF